MGKITEYTDFCGRGDMASLNLAVREFFSLAADMRERLGEQGYLLDMHVRLLLTAAASVPLHAVAERGNTAASRLRSLIRGILQGEETESGHPLYERVKVYIDAHPLSCQEPYTRHGIYFAELFGLFAEHTAERELQELPRHIEINAPLDIIKLQETRREICFLLHDEEDMERLEGLYRQAFLSVAPMAGFVRGMTDALLSELTSRDEETSKLIFQLMLDLRLAGQE